MISGRRVAREVALTVLFAIDAGRLTDAEEALAMFRAHLGEDDEVLAQLFFPAGDGEEPSPDPKRFGHLRRQLAESSQWPFVERLVRGVVGHLRAIDEMVGKASINWKMTRMNRVDRNILRMAAYELAFESDVPTRATLNEAIEMAKRYGTEDSGKFVNGILDRIAQQLGRLGGE